MKYLYVGTYEHPGIERYYRFLRYTYVNNELVALSCSDTFTHWDTGHSIGKIPWALDDKYASVEEFLASPLTCTAPTIPKFKKQYPELLI